MKSGLLHPVLLLLLLPLFALEACAAEPGPGGAADSKRKTMALEKNQLYKDFIHLTRENFTQTVIHSRMAWAVFFHEGMLERPWKLSAVKFRGILRFGMVNRKEEKELLKELKVANNIVARVYPYGGKIVKRKFIEDCRDGMEAIKKAEQSIPDKLKDLEEGGLEGFLLESYMSTPTRLPMLILTREATNPAMFRALALRFGRYFNFWVVRNPSKTKMRRLGLPSDYFYPVPGLVLLVSENFYDAERRKFYAVQYDKAEMKAELDYPNALMFLFQMNRQFRNTLPGKNGADDPAIMRAEDVLTAEREVFDIREDQFTGDERRLAPPTERPKALGKEEL